MAVFRLDEDEISFPNPFYAEENGFLAVGGDLSVERLILAYRCGIFPWYSEGEEIKWWCPKKRFVIFTDEIKISKSMKKFMRKTNFKCKFSNDFESVIHQCRITRECNEGTWITDDMERAYVNLYKRKYATSVEVYDDEELVGGLYGVSMGRCFFGESMFSKASNASKMALIVLANQLREKGGRFIDCQFHTEHLESMGGRYIDYREYISLIREGTIDD